MTWRLHGRGGRVSSPGRQPRSAESQGHAPRHVGSTGTRARHTSRPLANEWTRAPRGMNRPETRPSGQSRPTGQHRLDARDRVPSVRSGRRRDGRGWRQRQAGAHMPPSGAGFRSRGWREETTSFRGTVSMRLARGRSGRTARWSQSKAGLAPCCRRRRAASMEVLAPSRGKGGEPATLRRSDGTDLAA